MITASELISEELVRRLHRYYDQGYGAQQPDNPKIAAWAVHMALSIISNSDALYHDVDHTAKVTLVGQDILRGKQLVEGGVTPSDWLHFTVSLACHDIGYVRGLSPLDRGNQVSTGCGDEVMEIADGSTDAALTPWHVDRGIAFINSRFEETRVLDHEWIARCIEHTRFPVPKDDDHSSTGDFPGLLRAADLIGQLGDPGYLRKLSGLFHEFEETGVNQTLGYTHADDLRRGYPGFFWNAVYPFIKDALHFLKATTEGRVWISNLYAQLFAVEHDMDWR